MRTGTDSTEQKGVAGATTTESTVTSSSETVAIAESPAKDVPAKQADNRALAISLREVAAILGCRKRTAQLRLRREGIQPIRHGSSVNCKQWYPRREVDRMFCRLGLV